MITALKKTTNKSVGLELLEQFIKHEQLAHHNFHQLEELLAITSYEYRKGRISKDVISKISMGFGKEFLENTLHGRGFMKPNGYPGDYLFLDKIYTHHVSDNPKFAIWDEYVQQNAAPTAVRNRKAYFKHLVQSKARTARQINVLNIVSGSGRELAELYKTSPTKNMFTTCVEIDDEAIDFSKKLNKDYLNRIEYVNSNIFRYQANKTFDFIWSAGLFDYLNDKAFVNLLRRFKEWQRIGGEIVIGNYNEDHNPSRNYMEILGDWHLVHRTEGQLLHLAREAGFGEDEVHVSRMPDNVILYLHIHSN